MDSIDIFDTAIFRDVYEPRDIFKLVEKKLGNSFSEKRILAEKLAGQEKHCYNFKDIYQHLTDFKDLSNIELETEIEHCYANPKILKMYNKNPNNYVFISDMYLSSHFLKQLLMSKGYINPKVYVSSEWNAHKYDGTLYKKVIEREGQINKHYGDNYISDVVKARENNIEPVFYPALQNLDLSLPIVMNGMLKKYLALTANCDPISKVAYWYAPIIYEFTKWVLNNRQEGQKIYFLSRDMYLPYQIAKDYFKAKDVYYLHASRRSLSALILQSKACPKLRERVECVLSAEDKEQKLKEDITSCINYLKNMNISNNDIIVDVGYSGTVQEALKIINVKTKGLYMQLNEKIYFDVPLRSFFNRRPLQFLLLMEFPLCSPEDSIESYQNNKPLFIEDVNIRKEYAKSIEKIIMSQLDNVSRFNCNVTDLEQILVHLQFYPDKALIELFNSEIFSNREKVESGIGFYRDKILKGELFECYERSYAQPLFKKLLKEDKILNHLTRLLP